MKLDSSLRQQIIQQQQSLQFLQPEQIQELANASFTADDLLILDLMANYQDLAGLVASFNDATSQMVPELGNPISLERAQKNLETLKTHFKSDGEISPLEKDGLDIAKGQVNQFQEGSQKADSWYNQRQDFNSVSDMYYKTSDMLYNIPESSNPADLNTEQKKHRNKLQGFISQAGKHVRQERVDAYTANYCRRTGKLPADLTAAERSKINKSVDGEVRAALMVPIPEGAISKLGLKGIPDLKDPPAFDNGRQAVRDITTTRDGMIEIDSDKLKSLVDNLEAVKVHNGKRGDEVGCMSDSEEKSRWQAAGVAGELRSIAYENAYAKLEKQRNKKTPDGFIRSAPMAPLPGPSQAEVDAEYKKIIHQLGDRPVDNDPAGRVRAEKLYFLLADAHVAGDVHGGLDEKLKGVFPDFYRVADQVHPG